MRGVVVSSDEYNEQPGAIPHLLPIVRRSPDERPWEYVARLGEMDPIAGVVVVSDITEVHPHHQMKRVGMLTGASMEVIGTALRDFYDLN
jgi:mRNA-degrading endonuclease toxin of MazEF toxin-antitoxin module